MSAPLDRLCIVLHEPQDFVNIAAVVRAMKNMGLSRLRLVRPKPFDATEIERVAHDTRDIVARLATYDELDAALGDCIHVAGFTARRRAAKRPVLTPREAAAGWLALVREGPVALLFGREDSGLPNDALDRAQSVITIPTTEHASLNLAQAVLIAMYELHLAAPDATRALAPPRKDAPPARAEQLERWFVDAERALAAIDFFRTRNSELIMRTVRSLTASAAPDAREIDLVRAMALEVLRTIDRVRGKP